MYLVEDFIMYISKDGVSGELSPGSRLTQADAEYYFVQPEVINGLLLQKRLIREGNSTEKVIDKAKSIATTITNKMADFAQK